MKNIIKIENIEYIKKSKFDELEKKKVKTIYIDKEIKLSQKESLITDPAQVGGILPIDNKRDEGEDIKTDFGLFKKVNKPNVISEYNEEYEADVMNINGSKYSKEYFDKFKRMAKEFYKDVPEIYMKFSEKKNRFLRANPIIFLYGNKLAFILAPRIDDESMIDIEDAKEGEMKNE